MLLVISCFDSERPTVKVHLSLGLQLNPHLKAITSKGCFASLYNGETKLSGWILFDLYFPRTKLFTKFGFKIKHRLVPFIYCVFMTFCVLCSRFFIAFVFTTFFPFLISPWIIFPYSMTFCFCLFVFILPFLSLSAYCVHSTRFFFPFIFLPHSTILLLFLSSQIYISFFPSFYTHIFILTFLFFLSAYCVSILPVFSRHFFFHLLIHL